MPPFFSPEQRAQFMNSIKDESASRPKTEHLPAMAGMAVALGLAVGMESAITSVEEEPSSPSTLEILTGPEAEKNIKIAQWETSSFSVARVMVTEHHGKTVYHFLRAILKEEPAYKEAPQAYRADMIDAMIALSRRLNPEMDLDNFFSVVGKEIIVPVDFTWRPRVDRVLRGREYAVLQDMAEADGFPVRKGSQEEIYKNAFSQAQEIPAMGLSFFLDRAGSEDSPARLSPDVILELQDVGKQFSTTPLLGGSGWKFGLTDMMRDPHVQEKRESIKASTHSTARSFDVSDGRWLQPDGKLVTWSNFDANGKPTGPSAHAVTIDTTLRPTFEQLALNAGWVLYKEPYHWHVYVPKVVKLGLKEEWERERGNMREKEKEMQEHSEKKEPTFPELSGRIATALLGDAHLIEQGHWEEDKISEESTRLRGGLVSFFKDRLQREKQPQRPFLTALMEFPCNLSMDVKGDVPEDNEEAKLWFKSSILGLIRACRPPELVSLGLLEGTTVHQSGRPSFAELQHSWKWKQEHRIFPQYESIAKLIADQVGSLDHSMTLPAWYEKQQRICERVGARASALGFDPELVRYATPEVMLATIHAEFFSEFDGETFVALSPVLFEAYNIVFAPAANDRELSSGPVQLTEKTFLGTGGIVWNYGKKFGSLQTQPEFQGIVLPKKDALGVYADREIADAMVLNPESVLFWSYLSVLHHMQPGFSRLMKNADFQTCWAQASEADRLRFVAAFAPLANNGGIGRGKQAADYLLGHLQGKNLGELARDLSMSVSHTTATRGATKGLQTMDALIRLSESKEE